MRILLVQPPHEGREPSFFPLGLAYIARVLLDEGHKVEVLDIWAHQLGRDQVLGKIKRIDYDAVGISALSTQYSYVKWLTSVLKQFQKDKPIIIGGALPTHNPELVLTHTKANICVMDEGENTAKELVDNLGSLEKVKGICYMDPDGKIQANPPREYVKNLDEIGFPAWDLFPIRIYLKFSYLYGVEGLKVKNKNAMNVITTRGCPYNCRFCSKTFRGVRLRSSDNIVDEIKELKTRYAVNGIYFNDELFMVSKPRVLEMCSRLADLNVKWSCQGRTNIVDYELLRKMKKSGCISVGYGIESGSQKLLDAMNKRTTVGKAIRALEWTVKSGVEPIYQMMFGYPGEDISTLEETIDFFRKAPYSSSVFFITTPLPGSELYEYAKEKGVIANEEHYLETISGGYGAGELYANLTEFSQKEFCKLKDWVEREVRKIHLTYLLRRNPRKGLQAFWLMIRNRDKSYLRHLLQSVLRLFPRK